MENAICSDPDLSRLDREIEDAYKTALAARDGKGDARLRKNQHEFIAARNELFGNPLYDLRREMEMRLDTLRSISAKAQP